MLEHPNRGEEALELVRASTSEVNTMPPRRAAVAITIASMQAARGTAASASPVTLTSASSVWSITTAARSFSRRSVRPRHHSATHTLGTIIGTWLTRAVLKHRHDVMPIAFKGDECAGVEGEDHQAAELRLDRRRGAGCNLVTDLLHVLLTDPVPC